MPEYHGEATNAALHWSAVGGNYGVEKDVEVCSWVFLKF